MSEPLFFRQSLPRYFAVLRATSGGGPSYQFCETVCEVRDLQVDPPQSDSVCIVKNAEIPVETLRSLERKQEDVADQNPQIYEYRIRNESQSDIDIRKVRYWHLPHYFFWNECKIPVLDFNKRFFLTRSFVRILPSTTDDESMRSTTIHYEFLREHRVSKIPGISHAHQEIPQFVTKLLYEDKVSKQESCSISMTPFRDLATIGITPCFHLFDAPGLSRWIQTHHKCPLCRARITDFQIYETQPVN